MLKPTAPGYHDDNVLSNSYGYRRHMCSRLPRHVHAWAQARSHDEPSVPLPGSSRELQLVIAVPEDETHALQVLDNLPVREKLGEHVREHF